MVSFCSKVWLWSEIPNYRAVKFQIMVNYYRNFTLFVRFPPHCFGPENISYKCICMQFQIFLNFYLDCIKVKFIGGI